MKMLRLVIFALFLSGCATVNIESFSTLEVDVNSISPAQIKGTTDFYGIPLRSGQIIASDNNTALNLILLLTDQEYHPFSHAGIISIESGKPYVYHAVIQVNPLSTAPAAERASGFVARTSLRAFLKGIAVAAIYNPASVELGNSMAEFAAIAHANKLPYDTVFDPVDRSKVYCSEFIVSAIEFSGGEAIPLKPRSRHPSIDTVYEWLNIEAKEHYFVNGLISNSQRVALLSDKFNSKQIELYFALRKELHRRFTPDQKIGNIMTWGKLGPTLRPQVKLFIQRGLEQDFRKQARGESLGDWIMSLANEVLGPVI